MENTLHVFGKKKKKTQSVTKQPVLACSLEKCETTKVKRARHIPGLLEGVCAISLY